MGPAIKRRDVSSSSSDFDPASGVCSIEEFAASKDSFRVAPSGFIPTPHPFRLGVCSQRLREAYDSLEAKISEALRQHQINHTSKRCLSISSSDLTKKFDILMILSLDIDTSNWILAATELQDLFLSTGYTTSDIKVEIQNPDNACFDISYCISNDEQILGAMRESKNKVLAIIQKDLPNVWTSVAFHSRGRRDCPISARKPTVIVYCKPGSRQFFGKIETDIAAALHSSQYPGVALSLELLPGIMELAYEPPSPKMKSWPILQTQVQQLPDSGPANNASIGVQGNQEEAGTLGGWVTLTADGRPPMTCILTCYHVIQNGDPANRLQNDTHGIGLNGRNILRPIQVVYPSPYDSVPTRNFLQKQPPTPANAHTLSKLDQFSNNGIGFVRYASGHRKTEGDRRLDWALIESPTTVPRNQPPAAERLGLDSLEYGHIQYTTDPDDFITNFGAFRLNEWVVRAGRTSLRSGNVNSLLRPVNWYGNIISQECEVIGNAEDFAGGGDSGSWVVNQNKELVGILIGKELLGSGRWGCGLVTPIQDIVKDIHEKTGWTVSLP